MSFIVTPIYEFCIFTVFRKPKRMLTPGPQKTRCINPRFQALINRFENNGRTMARTPVTKRDLPITTPPMAEHTNMPRAINFKDESPAVSTESTTDLELYKSCIESPMESKMNEAITSLGANIAESLQNCLSALKTNELESEIQFKFIITKRTVSVNRIIEDGEGTIEKSSEIVRHMDSSNKENIWSSVAKAVKNVFWGGKGELAGIYKYLYFNIGAGNCTLGFTMDSHRTA